MICYTQADIHRVGEYKNDVKISKQPHTMEKAGEGLGLWKGRQSPQELIEDQGFEKESQFQLYTVPASRIPDSELSKASELRTKVNAPGLGPSRTKKARMPPRGSVGIAPEGAQELNMLVRELGEPAPCRTVAHRNEG